MDEIAVKGDPLEICQKMPSLQRSNIKKRNGLQKNLKKYKHNGSNKSVTAGKYVKNK